MPDYTDEDQEYPGNPSRDLAAEPPPEEAMARAPITAPGVVNRGVVNPGNWVYASSRYADQPTVQFPDQPPSQGPFPYGVNRFDLPNGVTAFHVSEDYRQKQFDLAKEAQAARIASEHAAQDAQMFQQMSRVAMSLKDISEARRQIDIMGLQRDIQNGIPIHEAVARHPMGLGAGYGNALRASAPVGQTRYVAPTGGAPGYVVDPRGTPHFPPNTEKPTWVPETADVPGHYETRGGAVHFPPKPTKTSMSDIDRMKLQKLYTSKENLEKEIGGASAETQATPGWKMLHQGDIDRLAKTQQDINALETKYGGTDAEPKKSVAVLGQGTREDPARPMTKEQFDSIPSKAYFINPADGALRQKK